MKRNILKYLLLAILVLPLFLNAQEKKEFKPVVKWDLTTQIWLRYADFNEGSFINNEPINNFMDISIRRLRIPVSSQVTPKIFLYSIFGGNNYNFKNRTFQLDVLDLYVEYSFDKALEIGIGKSGWQGLNRWNIRSAKTMMGLDTPLFTLNSVEKNDDLGRLFGVWVKGQFYKIDYRFTFNRPFITNTIPNGEVDFANNMPRVKTSAYVKYQFFEHESNKTAYQIGTYGNTKKVFTIGAGFQLQENATSDGDVMLPTTTLYNMKHWAIDTYLNLPLLNHAAITGYVGYYDYDFGKNYIRNVGANNPTTGGGSDFNGAGVAFPMIGTGATWYMQFGYAFKQTKMLGESFVIQPNIAIQSSNWDALNDVMTVYDFGVNFLLNGAHNTKFTLGYQHRPIFDATTIKQKEYKGMLVLQYQISLH